MDYPLDYIPNSGSQIERALAAYHKANGAVPDATRDDGGIFLTLAVASRQYIGRNILANTSEEDVRFSGNQSFLVNIVDQFDAMVQSGETNPEARRVAMDKQIGKMMSIMLATDNRQNFDKAVRAITDAGRSLAPITLALHAGTATARGTYNKVDNQNWQHATNDCSINYNPTTNLWELSDPTAVVLYTCSVGQFPEGPWAIAAGSAPAPTFTPDSKWNDCDMANFTCLFLQPISQSRGHPDGPDGIEDGVWREVRSFRIVACPTVVGGFSNTSDE